MTSKFTISVIVCSVEARKFAQATECYKRLIPAENLEIIGIHDAKSLAEGYNRGIRKARGDILIFSHDDIIICDPDFFTKLQERMAIYDLLGFAGSQKVVTGKWFGSGQPYTRGVVSHAQPKASHLSLDVFGVCQWPVADKIKVIDGLCMIAHRRMLDKVGFDEVNFNGFHLYDIDFSFSAYLAGFNIGVCCDIPIIHESGGRFDKSHQQFEQLFTEKHGANLDKILLSDRPAGTSEFTLGKGAMFRDVPALKRAWQRDILVRTTVSLHRPFKT